jgi:acetyltransferase-like isoleucine patch superfamily enzyme
MLRIFKYILLYRNNKRYKYLLKKIGVNNTVQIQKDIKISHPELLSIGDYVYIGPNASIQAIGKVTIGRGTICGPNLTIYSANHRFRDADSIPYDSVYLKKEVFIGDNVWIGGSVIIVPGTKIGEGSIIGAGTVVSGIIPPMSIVVGNPCRIIGKRDEKHYFKLKNEDKIYLKIKQKKI